MQKLSFHCYAIINPTKIFFLPIRNDNPEKKSAACQFYIVQAKEGIPRLDGDYTIFGQVIKGMEVVDAIVQAEKDSTNRPLTPLTLDVNIIELTKEEIQKIKN